MYKRHRHNIIHHLLQQFNTPYLEANNILFGGGTRISLALGEYRESIDIDFLCPSTASYRAARSVISSSSLGELVNGDIKFAREIQVSRYAIRTVAEFEDTKVKMEFISLDDYQLNPMQNSPFGVPCIDIDSCYITKLLAHADRQGDPLKKDFIDLMKMYEHWGEPSSKVWAEVERHYGSASKASIEKQLGRFIDDQEVVFNNCTSMDMSIIEHGVKMIDTATKWHDAMLCQEEKKRPNGTTI
jgi:hypothetical protein